jgi:heme-degrading monooxygenase HmoA
MLFGPDAARHPAQGGAMSVVVITTFPGARVERFQELWPQQEQTIKGISEDARRQGCMHHLFVHDNDGNMLVIDEWESREAFDRFFAAQEEIKRTVAEIGITGEPSAIHYQIIDTSDRF